ncbi:recombinase family protein [Clostridium butyricum]
MIKIDDLISFILEQYKFIGKNEKAISNKFELDNIEYNVYCYEEYISISAINLKTDRIIKLDTKKYSNFLDTLKNDNVNITFNNGRIHITLVNKSKTNILGYCRVSSKGQLDNNSLEQQEEEILNKYSSAEIFKEQFTGTTTDRPIFNSLVNSLKENDILVVTKLDRLARNTEEGIHLVQDLFNKGVSVHVLNVGLLENTTMGKFFLTTLLAVAEMERNTIIERTQTGKAIARTKEGYKEGRPQKFTNKQLEHALSLLSINGGDKSYSEVVEITGISKSTLIRENNKNKLCTEFKNVGGI